MKQIIVISFVSVILFLCSCQKSKTTQVTSTQTEMNDTLETVERQQMADSSDRDSTVGTKDSTDTEKRRITAEMAYEGVNNYCHREYDWSVAKDNPSMMYVAMGDETETEYQVIFRSYTGAFVYFYVNKASGATRMVEHVPALDIEEEAGTINLFDYLEKPSSR